MWLKQFESTNDSCTSDTKDSHPQFKSSSTPTSCFKHRKCLQHPSETDYNRRSCCRQASIPFHKLCHYLLSALWPTLGMKKSKTEAAPCRMLLEKKGIIGAQKVFVTCHDSTSALSYIQRVNTRLSTQTRVCQGGMVSQPQNCFLRSDVHRKQLTYLLMDISQENCS